MEMNNVKNNYILAVLAANGIQKKFFNVDMPAVMDVGSNMGIMSSHLEAYARAQ